MSASRMAPVSGVNDVMVTAMASGGWKASSAQRVRNDTVLALRPVRLYSAPWGQSGYSTK